MADATRENANLEYRRRRVKRIKKIIVTLFVILLLLPTVLSVFLCIKMFSMQQQIDMLVENKERQRQEEMVAQAKQKATLVPEIVQELEEPEKKEVYLTFEDGPSMNTEKILDVLKKEKVKATFFVTGKEDEYSEKIYKRIVREGHTLAMHSYSHNVNEIYRSKKSFEKDLEQISKLLHNVTGTFSTIYRFPGGSSTTVGKEDMEVLMEVLDEKGITYYDWNVISPDVTNPNVSKKEVIRQIMENVEGFDTAIVLMNDAINHPMTVKALPKLLQNMKENGYELLPMDEDTPVIQHNTKKQEETK